MQFPDEHLSIDTPENVILDYPVAGIGSRFLAALIDTILISLLQLLIALILVSIAYTIQKNPLDWATDHLPWVLAILGLISFAFLWGYYVFFEMLWNGQSPGKRWAKLRVIRTNGTPITLTESLIRNLIRLVDFLPAYYGIGVITMFLNDQARRLGDLAAGTLVIYDRTTITLESLSHRQSMLILPSATAQSATWPVERLTNQDIQLAEEFARRRYKLTNKEAIAQQIANLLLKRMEIPPETLKMMSAETIILDTLKRLQSRTDSPTDKA